MKNESNVDRIGAQRVQSGQELNGRLKLASQKQDTEVEKRLLIRVKVSFAWKANDTLNSMQIVLF